jgi:hypothetical protein
MATQSPDESLTLQYELRAILRKRVRPTQPMTNLENQLAFRHLKLKIFVCAMDTKPFYIELDTM